MFHVIAVLGVPDRLSLFVVVAVGGNVRDVVPATNYSVLGSCHLLVPRLVVLEVFHCLVEARAILALEAHAIPATVIMHLTEL